MNGASFSSQVEAVDCDREKGKERQRLQMVDNRTLARRQHNELSGLLAVMERCCCRHHHHLHHHHSRTA